MTKEDLTTPFRANTFCAKPKPVHPRPKPKELPEGSCYVDFPEQKKVDLDHGFIIEARKTKRKKEGFGVETVITTRMSITALTNTLEALDEIVSLDEQTGKGAFGRPYYFPMIY
jgi:hypothetical protein